MSEVTLAVIVPQKEEAQRLIDLYGKYFDDIVIQLAPKCKNFAETRNKTLKKIKTPFWFWADSDDEIINPENIKELTKIMERDKLDAVYLPYHYGYNEERELIAIHWRERLIRTSHPFKWIGAVHETLISDSQPTGIKDESVVVRHAYKNEEEIMKSALRNHKIMEEQVKKGDEDPRTLYYLGRSYFMMKDYRKAAQTLMIYTDVSGWDEQKYDAWMKIGDSLSLMDEHERAINANLEAVKLQPNWPDAYLKLGDLYLALEQPGRAIEWLTIGMSKKPPETLEIVDPTLYTYRPLISMALCYFGLAKVNDAKKWIDQALKYKPKSKMFKSAYNAITTAWMEEQTIKNAAWLGKFVEEKGNVKSYIDGLPGFIKNDLRLRPLRVKAYPPKKWPKKSIVFYCGEQWEEWGPDTLDRGMGGSEEAIVYLARELAQIGWHVTVYNQRVEEYMDNGFEFRVDPGTFPPETEGKRLFPIYKPWETFNPEDEFDVFIAWRNPWMADKLKIKARVKGVDMHDTPIGHQGIPEKALKALDKVFLKSDFQLKMSDTDLKEKGVVIPNGIVLEQFDNQIQRDPQKVIYASSADRGLDILVRKIWPKVKKQVPNAELSWAYGWNSYDAMHKGNAAQGKWKWELKRDMFNQGVKELGRLSHEDLAKEMQSSGVWAYMTEFPEIDCITAKKAGKAGLIPVTSGYAALKTSILEPQPDYGEQSYDDPKKINDFIKRVVKALKEGRSEADRQKVARKYDKFSWKNTAKRWDEELT